MIVARPHRVESVVLFVECMRVQNQGRKSVLLLVCRGHDARLYGRKLRRGSHDQFHIGAQTDERFGTTKGAIFLVSKKQSPLENRPFSFDLRFRTKENDFTRIFSLLFVYI